MSLTVENVLTKTLQMSPQDRAIIAERLISSLDVAVDTDVEVAWQKEVQRRMAQAAKGEATFFSWEDARQQLRERPIAAR